MQPGLPCVKQVPACCPNALASIQWFFFFLIFADDSEIRTEQSEDFLFYCSLTSVSCGIPGSVWESKTKLKECDIRGSLRFLQESAEEEAGGWRRVGWEHIVMRRWHSIHRSPIRSPHTETAPRVFSGYQISGWNVQKKKGTAANCISHPPWNTGATEGFRHWALLRKILMSGEEKNQRECWLSWRFSHSFLNFKYEISQTLSGKSTMAVSYPLPPIRSCSI